MLPSIQKVNGHPSYNPPLTQEQALFQKEVNLTILVSLEQFQEQQIQLKQQLEEKIERMTERIDLLQANLTQVTKELNQKQLERPSEEKTEWLTARIDLLQANLTQVTKELNQKQLERPFEEKIERITERIDLLQANLTQVTKELNQNHSQQLQFNQKFFDFCEKFYFSQVNIMDQLFEQQQKIALLQQNQQQAPSPFEGSLASSPHLPNNTTPLNHDITLGQRHLVPPLIAPSELSPPEAFLEPLPPLLDDALPPEVVLPDQEHLWTPLYEQKDEPFAWDTQEG